MRPGSLDEALQRVTSREEAEALYHAVETAIRQGKLDAYFERFDPGRLGSMFAPVNLPSTPDGSREESA